MFLVLVMFLTLIYTKQTYFFQKNVLNEQKGLPFSVKMISFLFLTIQNKILNKYKYFNDLLFSRYF